MKRIVQYLLACSLLLVCTALAAEVLDRKTVVITPRRIERGKARPGAAIEVFFAEDSTRLNRAARRTLRNLAIPLKAHVQVYGHTNSSGGKKYNRTLSRQRAQAVIAYLKRRHPHATYRYKALGESHPAYSNRTRAGYRLNRRVVVRIIAN